jgi:hypothetical protein
MKKSIEIMEATFGSSGEIENRTWPGCKTLLPHVQIVLEHATSDENSKLKQASISSRIGGTCWITATIRRRSRLSR